MTTKGVPFVSDARDLSTKPPVADRTPPDALRRAAAYGVDLTLLIENLRRSPTERLRGAEQTLRSVQAFREEARRAVEQAKRGR